MNGENSHYSEVPKGGRRPRRWLRAVLSGVVIVALTVAMLGYLTRLMERKDSVQKFQNFIHGDADIDVFFMGTSHVINGVFPMELWRDYGIASYNFAGHGNVFSITDWTLRNALDYTSPKVVVIDGLGLSSPYVFSKIGYVHTLFDAFPISATKVKAVLDLTEDQKLREELIWNFSVYHDRWIEIGKNDFVPGISVEKGAESRIAVAENVVFSPIDKSQVLAEDTVGVEYYRKTIEDCQERGIDVLLTYLPFPASEIEQMEANSIPEIAAEYGVDYINFLDLDVIDFNTDCYDNASHLNPSGARKVTDYLGQYIMEHYDIPDRRDDPDYADWHEDYTVYTAFKVNNLAGQKDMKNYLMLLQDKHLSSILCLAPGEVWHGDSIYKKLLANLGIESERLYTDVPTLVVADNKAGTVSYLAPGEETDASFGHLAFAQGEGAYQSLLDGAVQLEMTDQTLAAVVVDDATDQVVTTAQFKADTVATFTKIG